MSAAWQRLFIPNSDQGEVVTALTAAYIERGFKRFDPFPGGTGTPPGLKETFRHFVTPAQEGWVMVIGTTSADFSLPMPYLRGWIDADGGWEAYRDGTLDPAGLTTYLKAGKSRADVEAIQGRPMLGVVDTAQANSTLPPDVQKLAQERGVNADQANKMIGRLTSQLFGKMDRQSGGEASAMQQQAQAALSKAMSGPAKVDWNAAPARQLIALSAVLTIPTEWRAPEFEALREAYQVARRLERNPKAALLPDEKEALAAVPNAGAYQPVYVGK
ncbi:MAG: hypothetical protein KF716_24635 [Anaerolineae bacterium]|nr:hypothetical protein [Anaerolineae bacterium]